MFLSALFLSSDFVVPFFYHALHTNEKDREKWEETTWFWKLSGCSGSGRAPMGNEETHELLPLAPLTEPQLTNLPFEQPRYLRGIKKSVRRFVSRALKTPGFAEVDIRSVSDWPVDCSARRRVFRE